MRRRNQAHFWTLVDSRTLPTPCRHVVSAAGCPGRQRRCKAGVGPTGRAVATASTSPFVALRWLLFPSVKPWPLSSPADKCQPCLVAVKCFPLQRSVTRNGVLHPQPVWAIVDRCLQNWFGGQWPGQGCQGDWRWLARRLEFAALWLSDLEQIVPPSPTSAPQSVRQGSWLPVYATQDQGQNAQGFLLAPNTYQDFTDRICENYR